MTPQEMVAKLRDAAAAGKRLRWMSTPELDDDAGEPELTPDERPNSKALVACAHRGCDVRVQRYGGMWWHVAPAGAHHPRPRVDLAVNHG